MPDDGVGNRFVRGALWMLLAKLLERGLGLISTLVLARLLLPADFGLVALAAPVIALVELLGAFGLDYALIRSQQPGRLVLDTAWTLKGATGLVLGAVLVLVAPMAASYMREPRLESVLCWLALGVTIQAFENTGIVAFRKEIRMGQDVALLLGKKLGSLVLAAGSALAFGNYWALVIGTVGSRALGVALSYALTDFRPRLALGAWRDLLGFSAWMFVNNIVSFIHHRASDAIIGRALGSTSLAYFSISMDLAATVTGEAMSSISRAAFPAFSKLSADRVRLAKGLRLVLAGLASFSLPTGVLLALMAQPLVLLLFGPKWDAAAPVLAQLSVCTAIMGIFGQISYVYMSMDKPQVTTYLSIALVAILLLTATVLFPKYGLQAAGWVYGSFAGSMAIGHVLVLRRHLPEFARSDWLAAFWKPTISTGVMALVVRQVQDALPPASDSMTAAMQVFSMSAVALVVYAVSLGVLWHATGRQEGPEQLAAQAISRILKKGAGRRRDG